MLSQDVMRRSRMHPRPQTTTSRSQLIREDVGAPVLLHSANNMLWREIHGEIAHWPPHHGQRIGVASTEIEILHTPGHSPGSLCLYARALAAAVGTSSLCIYGSCRRSSKRSGMTWCATGLVSCRSLDVSIAARRSGVRSPTCVASVINWVPRRHSDGSGSRSGGWSEVPDGSRFGQSEEMTRV